jgi:DNA-binding GntR family transcriptional regulator
MQEPPDMELRPALTESAEQREEIVELRYDLIEALQHHPDGLTDEDLAARTGRDAQIIREAMGDLANAQIVEVLPRLDDRAVSPGEPEPEQAYRLIAI